MPCDFIDLKEIKKEDIFSFLFFTRTVQFVPNLVEIGRAVLEKMFKFHLCIFAVSLLSPIAQGSGPSFEQP